ncbi:DUF5682 family protein [Marinobacterium weihaiense]|uniref:4-aminobutyrate aminotransferase n=1 Tax=Marinobacterium weihaiense TaxID=2851016 RepID=A0ABS6M6D5_9GAMM|nr:DUF5682 family protein [Marinobacterium weihaiense]MBV0931740.1 hypothetical protein [Marinobacterium weihaiense]
MKLDDQVHLLGIRHHGPGCAAALQRALEALQPDVILLEGAKELEDSWQDMLKPDMQPPVAQLLYDPAQPRCSMIYPWAEFTPEWQAMHFAGQASIPLQMIDLPASITFSLDEQGDNGNLSAEADIEADSTEPEAESGTSHPLPEPDSLHTFLHRCGIVDAEVWWDQYVEHHRGGLDSFAAIFELVSSARPDPLLTGDPREALREAWMRRELRAARKQYHNIVVICGAWHLPALAAKAKVKDDNALLKGLRKRKIDQAWIPYTYQRLSTHSGYNAGIAAPGWYEHLYRYQHQDASPEQLAIAWMVRVAANLRSQGFATSSAQVIDAVRLALSLARLRDQHMPGLAELMEAAQSVMTEGRQAPIERIGPSLLVGERIGSIPADSPILPLEQDFNATLKRLRLKRTQEPQQVQLDLRQPNALLKSQLFNRLDLLSIPWAAGGESIGTGTSRETWDLNWQPEFAIALLDASLYGNTLESAATARLKERLDTADSAPVLLDAVDALLRCHLPGLMAPAIQRLGDAIAVSADLGELMQALLKIAQIIRYGSVRALRADELMPLTDVISIRVCNGLPQVCTGIDDDAARALLQSVDAAHSAIGMLSRDDLLERWHASLQALWANRCIHPLIQGRVGRMLLDTDRVEPEALEHELSLRLSDPEDPMAAAYWVEGMLAGSAAGLIYGTAVFQLLDHWLCRLSEDHLLQVLPVLRRAFSSFSAQDLQLTGRHVRHGHNRRADTPHTHDARLVQQARQQLGRLLGLGLPATETP